ncbi:outer membrane beta-barrel protein [Desulfobacula phenolica]|uniref:Uncharacterized protein, PEP-CTERM system associated n=1 Tax=Desulfobacula phenolica TaxID=90732 RepID=A0A1H2ENC4_9BACT|nr:outer membrane beta-barrel protein [Desulfobacula phenolica]SDT96626.1 uncharacterized protein, PEP-CTERM system associated [Desulfobacula phenolica]
MGKKKYGQKWIVIWTSTLLILFFSYSFAFSRTVTQLIPTLTITEEYNDNYFQTENNTQEEYITSYGLGFSAGFLYKKINLYLGYNPEYRDYKNLDDRDGFEHYVSLDGEFNPSKYTNINARLAYTTKDDKESGETWENTAAIYGDTQFTQNTNLDYSHFYSKSFDQQLRTGTYNEHELNRATVGITNQFGKKDRMGLNFSYELDDYKNSNADGYTRYNPSGFITYWITPLNGLDSQIAYRNTDFDESFDDIETYTGHIRYLRKFSELFDGYLKYRHSYSQRDSGDHHIYHPSVGFDWETGTDSHISLGIGILFSEWDNDNDDSNDLFFEMDAYKIFHFSKRGSLSITGSSGYSEAGDDAASLGYNLYYKAGLKLNYQMQKRLSSNLFGSYQRDEFPESDIDRTDNIITLGGGLSWSPLQWLRLNLSYAHTDFDTNTSQRGDYTENKVIFSVRFIPSQPVWPTPESSRQSLENEIYN